MTDFGKGRKRKYLKADVTAAQGSHRLLKTAGQTIGSMSVPQLAYWALSSPSDMHRIACVATLLDEIGLGHEVRAVLTSLKTREP